MDASPTDETIRARQFVVSLCRHGIYVNQDTGADLLKSASRILNADMRKAEDLLLHIEATLHADLSRKSLFRRFYWHSRATKLLDILLRAVREHRRRHGVALNATYIAACLNCPVGFADDAAADAPRFSGRLGQLVDAINNAEYGEDVRQDMSSFLGQLPGYNQANIACCRVLAEILYGPNIIAEEYLSQKAV